MSTKPRPSDGTVHVRHRPRLLAMFPGLRKPVTFSRYQSDDTVMGNHLIKGHPAAHPVAMPKGGGVQGQNQAYADIEMSPGSP